MSIKFLISLAFIFFTFVLFGQDDCFKTFYNKGIGQLAMEEFDAAIKSFKAAKVCNDIPAANDVDDKIVEAQNGFINAIQKERNKVKSLYLAMLARKAFEEGDPLLGFRLSEKAYRLDENTTTQELLISFQEKYDKLFQSGRRFKSLKRFAGYYLGEAENGSVWVFDLDSENFKPLKVGNNILKVKKLVVSDDEQFIATIPVDGPPFIWNNKGDMVKRLLIHTGPVYDLSFSTDSKYIITASHDQTAGLWTVDGELVRLLKGHDQPLIAAEFSPDGQYILTASVDAKSIVWDKNGNKIGEKEKVYNDPVLETGFAPDSKNVVAISSSDCVVIYDLRFSEGSKAEIRPKQSKDPETIKGVVISEDGQFVLVLLKNRESFDEMAILYNRNGDIIQRLDQNDLLWMKIPIGNNEDLLVLTKNGEVSLRKLTERNQKSSIIDEYSQYLRELTELEKFTYGIEN